MCFNSPRDPHQRHLGHPPRPGQTTDRLHPGEARGRQVEVTIVCDFIHVVEYLWSAAWSFFTQSNPAAEKWVADKAPAVLNGKASTVAAAIRRKATTHGLDTRTRLGPACRLSAVPIAERRADAVGA